MRAQRVEGSPLAALTTAYICIALGLALAIIGTGIML